MPIRCDFRLTLKLDEVLRAQGIKDYSRLKPTMKSAIHELLDRVNDGDLVEPAVVYETYHVAEVTDNHLKVEGNDAVLHGSLLHSVLAEARQLAVAVCTIGPALERQASDYFSQGESLRGLLLDGIGSAAVGALGSETCQTIGREASVRGYQAGSPISPGSPRFPVSEQWELFRMAPAQDIGVRLSESGLMIPRKSLSMIIGLGPQMGTWTATESCDHCNLSRTCRYRAHASKPVSPQKAK